MAKRCIICGKNKFKTVVKIGKAPVSIGKLSDSKITKRNEGTPLFLEICVNCKLSQLRKNNFIDDNDYYDDYQMAVSYSGQMQEYQKWLAAHFVKYFNLKGGHCFEIGCGDGMFSLFLSDNGLKTTGIEPSKSFYNLAKSKIKVLNRYFDGRIPLKRNFYDAFAARQVFEHLKDPNRVLQDVKLYLKPDGVGLIEVPSFTTALKNRRCYDVFRDHVAYYTEYTLQYLLTVNNFQIVKIFHTAMGEYLTAYFKNNEYHNEELKLFSSDYKNYKKNTEVFFASHKNKKIAVWGAGGKGIAFLSLCSAKKKNISFVIDSDSNKWNKYTPGSGFIVHSPKNVDFNSIDLVLISAVMYQKEIIRNLKNKYGYKNKIGVIVPEPHII
ncbi:MAG: class I SAM-dependent methyltransferase [Candidatus Omnitrophica bacterium]|nr:class I SAM-dependent methyltransferase [Candidatus Omnitrophota bacterium]